MHSPAADLGLREARRRGTHDPLYSAEVVFLDRLMKDWSVRTLDPHRARLWYVPTWLLSAYTNIVYEKGVQHYHQLVKELEASDPIFAAMWRQNRSRHVFFLAGDKGACLWPRGPIYMSHWGLTVPWKAMMLPHMWESDALVSARAKEAPCADERDIIVPPVIVKHRIPVAHTTSQTLAPAYLPPPPPPLSAAAAASASSPSADGLYKCELFFAGAFHAEHKIAKSSWCDDGRKGGVKCYSQGVRAAVYAHHANRTRFCLAPRLPSELYFASRFCLAPSGEGFGDRLSLSMLAGCVPLIIQPAVRQPLDDVLPYQNFALRVGADAIPRLHERLARVTPAEHARLREGVRRFSRAFDWYSGGGLAYNLTRLALCERAGLATCDRFKPAGLDLSHREGSGAQAGVAAHHTRGERARWADDPNVGRVDGSLHRVAG